jgi:SET domain-containing protein
VSGTSGRRLVVRRSRIHGRGVFAATTFAANDFVVEFAGEVISWDEAQSRYATQSGTQAGHTFLFDLGEGRVIDGGHGGNSARWMNHSCNPNCDAVIEAGTIVIRASRPISLGEELLIDYQLTVDCSDDPALRSVYSCACGGSTCRGTMLAP